MHAKCLRTEASLGEGGVFLHKACRLQLFTSCKLVKCIYHCVACHFTPGLLRLPAVALLSGKHVRSKLSDATGAVRLSLNSPEHAHKTGHKNK